MLDWARLDCSHVVAAELEAHGASIDRERHSARVTVESAPIQVSPAPSLIQLAREMPGGQAVHDARFDTRGRCPYVPALSTDA